MSVIPLLSRPFDCLQRIETLAYFIVSENAVYNLGSAFKMMMALSSSSTSIPMFCRSNMSLLNSSRFSLIDLVFVILKLNTLPFKYILSCRDLVINRDSSLAQIPAAVFSEVISLRTLSSK